MEIQGSDIDKAAALRSVIELRHKVTEIARALTANQVTTDTIDAALGAALLSQMLAVYCWAELRPAPALPRNLKATTGRYKPVRRAQGRGSTTT